MSQKIEVCIPMWNEYAQIEATLAALNNQTFRDFKISLFDNASDDNTVDLCQSYETDIEINIYRRTKNIGQTANMNRMYANSNAEFVALLSANDIVADDYLEALLAEFSREPEIGSAYSHATYVDDSGVPFPNQPTNWEFFSLFDDDAVARACGSVEKYCQATNFFALYRKSVLDRMQPQPFCYGGDHIFACEAAIYGKVACTKATTVGRSPPPGSQSPEKRAQHLINLFSLDHQRGLPGNSKMGAFDRITPNVDMFHGYLGMFRLADLPHDDRARLVNAGCQSFLKRFGSGLDGDLNRFKPVAQQIADAVTANDPLTRMMAFHALRKIDQCLFLKRDPELMDVRAQLSRAYCA
jgi:hypothetical protein